MTLQEKTAKASVTDTKAVPLYLQVASTLRTAIVRGIYPVGSRIPTEEELCERFAVSRYTVREALQRLRSDGLITSRQGGRPVVVSLAAQDAIRMFSAEMGKDFFDYTMGTRLSVDEAKMIAADEALVAQFDIAEGSEWLRVLGYRHSGDGHLVCWHQYLIPADLAEIEAVLDNSVGPIIPLIEEMTGEKIARVTQSVSAVAMPPAQAARFGVGEGSPALRIVTRGETARGALGLFSVSMHPGDEIGYSIRLQDRSGSKR